MANRPETKVCDIDPAVKTMKFYVTDETYQVELRLTHNVFTIKRTCLHLI